MIGNSLIRRLVLAVTAAVAFGGILALPSATEATQDRATIAHELTAAGVVQTFTTNADALAEIEVRLATWDRPVRASLDGQLRTIDGQLLAAWSSGLRTWDDNAWLQIPLPAAVANSHAQLELHLQRRDDGQMPIGVWASSVDALLGGELTVQDAVVPGDLAMIVHANVDGDTVIARGAAITREIRSGVRDNRLFVALWLSAVAGLFVVAALVPRRNPDRMNEQHRLPNQ